MFIDFWEKNLMRELCQEIAASRLLTAPACESLWAMRQTMPLFHPNDTAVSIQMADDQHPLSYFDKVN